MNKTYRMNNLEGFRFGRLIAISLERRNHKHSWWKCKCDCGNEKIILRNNLIRNLTRSCGCLSSESRTAVRKKQVSDYWSNENAQELSGWRALYKQYISRSNKKKMEFNLTLDEFKEKCLQACVYCNEKPINNFVNHNKRTFKYNGIDRIDNNIGYNSKNIQTLCIICNKIKSNLSEEFLETHLTKICNSLKNKRIKKEG